MLVRMVGRPYRGPCSSGKESACDAGAQGLIPGWGGSSGEGNGNPLFETPWTVLCQVPLFMELSRVGCHFLLQGIFLTQELNPSLLHLLHWQVDSLPLHYLGSPLIHTINSKFKWHHHICLVNIQNVIKSSNTVVSILKKRHQWEAEERSWTKSGKI